MPSRPSLAAAPLQPLCQTADRRARRWAGERGNTNARSTPAHSQPACPRLAARPPCPALPQYLQLLEEQTRKKAEVKKKKYAGPMLRFLSRGVDGTERVGGRAGRAGRGPVDGERGRAGMSGVIMWWSGRREGWAACAAALAGAQVLPAASTPHAATPGHATPPSPPRPAPPPRRARSRCATCRPQQSCCPR